MGSGLTGHDMLNSAQPKFSFSGGKPASRSFKFLAAGLVLRAPTMKSNPRLISLIDPSILKSVIRTSPDTGSSRLAHQWRPKTCRIEDSDCWLFEIYSYGLLARVLSHSNFISWASFVSTSTTYQHTHTVEHAKSNPVNPQPSSERRNSGLPNHSVSGILTDVKGCFDSTCTKKKKRSFGFDSLERCIWLSWYCLTRYGIPIFLSGNRYSNSDIRVHEAHPKSCSSDAFIRFRITRADGETFQSSIYLQLSDEYAILSLAVLLMINRCGRWDGKTTTSDRNCRHQPAYATTPARNREDTPWVPVERRGSPQRHRMFVGQTEKDSQLFEMRNLKP